MNSTLSPPKIIFLHDQAAYPLEPGVPLTFGRSDRGPVDHAQHVQLAHREMASHHCQVSWDGHVVVFAPLQLEHPSYVNGQAISQGVVVGHGSVLTFGPFNIELDAPEQTTIQTLTEPPAVAKTIGPIPLEDGLTIGCGNSCSVCLQSEEFEDYPDGTLQVLIQTNTEGFQVTDQGSEPAWLNGQLFSSEDLVIGDQLQVGTQSLRFDGRALVGVARTLGGDLNAVGISMSYGDTHVLHETNFHAPPGGFIGILGPSGHGKTTLLKVISGIERPQSGQVLVNGIDLFESLDYNRSLMGYVPQDDIVHGELTVWDALAYSAYLRLPDWTSEQEIHKLIVRILQDLGLYRPDKNVDHTRKRLTELSGGQRKRVSVAVELLNRPQILFLDEPTSGLDPGMEFELMSTLRSLTQSGCTVICTTHVLENVFLMDSMAVIYQGRRVFQGNSARARTHFGVDRLSEVYTRLDEDRQRWIDSADPPPGSQTPAEEPVDGRLEAALHKSTPRAIKHLLARHWAILRSDRKNLLLLFGQPVIIGLLITLAAVTEGAVITKLFLAHVATFWFGCSNAAQEIVKERAIFTREKFVGLSVNAYLLGKVFALGSTACLQALLLYGVLFINVHKNPEPVPGNSLWQITAMLLTALTATGIGLALSSWAKRQSQAVLMVPLIIIPQILLAGYVFPLDLWRPHEEDGSPVVQRFIGLLSATTPSGAAQKIMDTSYYWQIPPRSPGAANAETLYDNLQIAQWKKRKRSQDNVEPQSYTDAANAKFGIAVLLIWSLISYAFAWIHLKRT